MSYDRVSLQEGILEIFVERAEVLVSVVPHGYSLASVKWTRETTQDFSKRKDRHKDKDRHKKYAAKVAADPERAAHRGAQKAASARRRYVREK